MSVCAVRALECVGCFVSPGSAIPGTPSLPPQAQCFGRAIGPSIKCNASSKDVLRYTNLISLQNDSSGFMIYNDSKTACHYKMTNQVGCQIS